MKRFLRAAAAFFIAISTCAQADVLTFDYGTWLEQNEGENPYGVIWDQP